MNLWFISVALASLSVPVAVIVKIIFFKPKTAEESSRLHPTGEQLAWQSAVHNIRTRYRFYTAIRRKLDGYNENVNMDVNANTYNDSTISYNTSIELIEQVESPEISPKSTDSLLI